MIRRAAAMIPARAPAVPDWSAIPLVALYAATLLVGASLLFVAQPMVGKMILPLLGGTPSVWTTCMLFFQAALLAGYGYAHASAAWLGARRQRWLHVVVLALPLFVLPITVNPGLARDGHPALGVLLLLSASIGLPFLVVSATAPLLQLWFANTRHRAAGDPYFLYAASNLGSMLALLAYPTLIEPRLPLTSPDGLSQARAWSLGYLLLAGLVLVCALCVPRDGPPPADSDASGPPMAAEGAVTARRRLAWIALAFVPSSLLLGATTYMTTDIAAVPLLWVLPLAVYLLTFILAFGRWPAWVHRMVMALATPVALFVFFLVLSKLHERIWVSMLWHLALLLVVGLACHGELSRDRPPARHLTGFYLWVATGGVLGGLFNALVAPIAFNSLLEYPLVMIVAIALLSARREPTRPRRGLLGDVWLALGIGALALVLYSGTLAIHLRVASLASLLSPVAPTTTEWIEWAEQAVNALLRIGPPLLLAGLLRRRPAVLAAALVAALAVAGFVDALANDQIRQARSFFGTLRITRQPEEDGYVELRHGTTLHGRQSRDPARKATPLSYYHRKGPLGDVFAELERRGRSLRVGVIGLGAGTVAAYARLGDAFTFYEIDRLVRDISWDGPYFTYVGDARRRGAILRLELGDARRRLEAVRRERPGERYDLIVVDAFTSDAIPAHLITREALRLYRQALAPDGMIAFHVSNRYLRLEPVLANLARDAGLGGCLAGDDDPLREGGATGSTWVALAETSAPLGGLRGNPHWTAAAPDAGVGVWTDDFHNLASVFRWR